MGDSDAAGRRARGHRRTETTKEAKLWSLGTRWWWPGATQGRATPQPCAPRGSKQGDGGGGTWGQRRWPCGVPSAAATPLAPGSWERLRTGTNQGPPSACPLPEPPRRWGWGRATRATCPHPCPRPHHPMGPTRCRSASGTGSGSPAACPRPRCARRRVQPSPQPLGLPLPRVPDGTGDTKPHCGSSSPARELWVCSPPLPALRPPPTPLPPQGTAPTLGTASPGGLVGDTGGTQACTGGPQRWPCPMGGERGRGARPGRRPQEGWCRIQKYFPCRAGGGWGGAAINSCCCH